MNLARFADESDCPLRRLDSRVKTVVLLSGVVVASVLSQWYLALGLWLSAISLFSLMSFDPRALLKRLIMPMGIAWLVFLSVLFTHGSRPLFTIPLYYFSLDAYQEGLVFGIVLFLRIMAAVTLVAALSFSTPMIDILETLRMCKVPHTVIDIADMMYRYVFIMQDTAFTLRQAQISRLGETVSWLRRVGDTGRVAGSILIRSLDRSTRIYQAMLSRGYDEDSHELRFFTAKVPRRDKLMGLAAGSLLVLIVLLNLLSR
ncbi:cobalt ECF transporter T component CbiQ [Sodalis sp. dw_96]|uniref:cobalt ECF transporter T component CbiQ n=1 Tax=Sodalis sp. dw_96 TaxID=2719794 RepID=UPI001BD5E1F1|nr:cobalt ECF transporter T component CbiQ [Sodalis sp. dw_96]